MNDMLKLHIPNESELEYRKVLLSNVDTMS